jgi:hypothetical protein
MTRLSRTRILDCTRTAFLTLRLVGADESNSVFLLFNTYINPCNIEAQIPFSVCVIYNIEFVLFADERANYGEFASWEEESL